MSGERPPSIFQPNRGSSSNGFLTPTDQQTRYYFRPDHTQESASLEPEKPDQFNWTALVVGVTVALVVSTVIVAVAVVVTEQSAAANEVSATTPIRNSSVTQSPGLSMPTTTTRTTTTTGTTTTTRTTTTTTRATTTTTRTTARPTTVRVSNANGAQQLGQTISPVSSTAYMYSPALCSDNTWIKMPGVYVYSTTISPPGVFSPTECQSRCLELSICLGAWWNSYSVEGCQLVYYDPSLGYGSGPQYTYYVLIRKQSNCDANRTCVYIWTQAYNIQALGATRIPYVISVSDCVISCQNNANCSGVDFDTNQNYCWLFLNTKNSSRTQYGPGISHFNKDCRDPNATTTTLSTPSTTTTLSTPSTTSSLCPYYNARYCEPTKQCILDNQICDKYQDCPNDIDETNCTCDANHYQCQNGRCIYRSWLCDGVDDCPLKDDENPPQCSTCDASKFLCGKTHTCISMSQRCDGISNCSDSVDEANCLTLDENGTESEGMNFTTYLVNATYRGISGYFICSDNWNDTWSDSVCQNIGYRKSSATSFESVSGVASFLTLNLSASSPNLLAHLQISRCISNKAVAISCSYSECGTRGDLPPDSVGPYIINGQRAKRGAWPWQVLYEIGTYYRNTDISYFDWFSYCGGVVLNERWILTAGHCTQAPSGFSYVGQVRPESVRISLGSLSRTGDNDTVRVRVDRVYTHPSYVTDPVADNDVGLLRLSEPLTFTDTIRPICLPSSTEDLSQFRVCVDTGYGQTTLGSSSDYLLQARMNVIPYNDCYYYYGYFLRGQTQICIGTLPTENDLNVCFGDSGGPFACEDFTGTWKVIGINSYVIGNAQTCSRSIVARVTAYVDWIEQTMAANPV